MLFLYKQIYLNGPIFSPCALWETIFVRFLWPQVFLIRIMAFLCAISSLKGQRERKSERERDIETDMQTDRKRQHAIHLFFFFSSQFSLTLIIIASLLSLPLSFSLVKSKSKSFQNKKSADQKKMQESRRFALFPIKQKKLVQICESKSSPRSV